jgi:hypothetical protein
VQKGLHLVTAGPPAPDSATHHGDNWPDTQQNYEIRVEGHLGDSWASWFDELEFRHTECGDTILSGPLPDQTALHGVLMKIRDLGLTLIAVTRIQEDQANPN